MTSLPKKISGVTGALNINSVSKCYGSFVALDDVSLAINPGEFVALLGPSGSGKSTLLMMIAGFESTTTGVIELDGKNINGVPAYARGLGIVFQNYALFPHMTVAENIAYPLRRRGMDRDQIEAEVKRALEMVALEKYGKRLPTQLSGGQQQRVRLARALVSRPPVQLMDEPLGALDRKLRQQLQTEIKLIHKELGSTVIFVTHDQEEALSMADRVAVMGGGRIQQFGTPRELYEQPQNAFVADFIGEMNFIPVDISHGSNGARVTNSSCSIDLPVPAAQVFTDTSKGRAAIRPEHIEIIPDAASDAKVVESSYTGTSQNVLFQLGGKRYSARAPVLPGRPLFNSGEHVRVVFDSNYVRVFEE